MCNIILQLPHLAWFYPSTFTDSHINFVKQYPLILLRPYHCPGIYAEEQSDKCVVGERAKQYCRWLWHKIWSMDHFSTDTDQQIPPASLHHLPSYFCCRLSTSILFYVYCFIFHGHTPKKGNPGWMPALRRHSPSPSSPPRCFDVYILSFVSWLLNHKEESRERQPLPGVVCLEQTFPIPVLSSKMFGIYNYSFIAQLSAQPQRSPKKRNHPRGCLSCADILHR